MKHHIVQLALDLPLEKNFDFFATDATEADIGRLAVAPFGNKLVCGVIVGVGEGTDVAQDKLRTIAHVQRGLPKFSADDFALIRFCQSYYHHPLGPIALNGHVAVAPSAIPRKCLRCMSTPKRSVGTISTEAGRLIG